MQGTPQVINTLLIVYSGIIISNCFLYVVLWKKYKHHLYKLGFMLWVLTFVNFFLQGVFSNLNYLAVSAFSTYFFAGLVLVRMLSILSETNLDLKQFYPFYFVAMAISGGLSFLTDKFAFIAMPVAMVISLPMLITSFRIIFCKFPNKKIEFDVKVLAFLVFIQSIHFLDYPILRPIESAALFGFSFALCVNLAFSILIPIIIVRYQLQKHNRELKSEIDRRKEVESELIVALEDSKVAEKVKDQFLSNMSHEMKTPLNIILGMNSLLAETELNSSQKEFSTSIGESGNRLLSIVSNVLSFTSVSSRNRFKVNSKISVDDFNYKIEEIINSYKTENNKLGINLGASSKVLSGDIDKILQIIRCLVENAFKFAGNSLITIETKFIGNDGQKAQLIFSVKDGGPGIGRAKIKYIFENFEQGDNSNSRTFGGIGLGLALAKKITEFLGGTLSVESKLGEGTKFDFCIPVKLLQEEIESKHSRPVEPNTPTQKAILHSLKPALTETNTRFQTMKILVADDDKTCQFLMRKMLENLGMEIYVVENGRQAVDICKRIHFDFALIDLQMPVMTGFEAIYEMRKVEAKLKRIKTHVIALSAGGEADKSFKDRALGSGADIYLDKPVRLDKITEVMGQHLDYSSAK